MTQLMLFDAPASSATILPTAQQATAQQATAQQATVSQPTSSKPTVEPVEGVQRMGDLARLVLLRYQLVAQRRAVQAARTAATHSVS
ncbi:MAG: hypothetical protein AAFU85_10675 [Planctomycetota bacterium]